MDANGGQNILLRQLRELCNVRQAFNESKEVLL